MATWPFELWSEFPVVHGSNLMGPVQHWRPGLRRSKLSVYRQTGALRDKKFGLPYPRAMVAWGDGGDFASTPFIPLKVSCFLLWGRLAKWNTAVVSGGGIRYASA